MTIAQRERAALVATLREQAPDAPTLCDGWDARDLAAHLVVRERRLDAAPGILIPAFADYTERVQKNVASSTDWDELVGQVASGPPLYSPFKLLDPIANVAEMFIHHEDVRRARPGWEPRPLDEPTASALRRPVQMMARMTLRKAPATVVLATPDGDTLATLGSGTQVKVTGDAGELLMFAAGRDEARVEFDGPADAVALVKKSRAGL
ncbi:MULTISPECIES: TIGR03085 family metal-binding protein [Mycobacteriaceae]|uniref:TIGR03085 family metal-binding protein n=1 Tax=Mycolicibacterium parafortuitum TaxID=39692 RepID=A0ACC6MQ43_MYCPF|nr:MULTISPECIES: TIGR03085 family metal-binding protein [Mycobacteriaceae]MDZ5089048.1 TIGR03085 family metal-binding protein [Mycolicibacterium parafortuitum]GFM20861.1 TIGR03085 family protein [Mycobacterium sp. PO1]GFM26233.1 TIGR03085 family protein [Mycobacterium sp. PO2]